MTHRHIDQALQELRTLPDPYARLNEANSLDAALVNARSVVAQVKRDAVNALRSSTTGYGTIAERLGLTKARIQQIANSPKKAWVAAYAFRDEQGNWHGNPDLLPNGHYHDSPSFVPFSPSDKYNPLADQTMRVRYGPVDEEYGVSAYTVQVRQDDDSPLNLRMTHPVMSALFGPPIAGSPDRQRWEAAREQRMRELSDPTH